MVFTLPLRFIALKRYAGVIMNRTERIGFALDYAGKRKVDLARELGLSRHELSNTRFDEIHFDSIKYLEAVSRMTSFYFYWLRTGEGPRTAEELSTFSDDREFARMLSNLMQDNFRLKFENEILRKALTKEECKIHGGR
jgi:hypothetical protein